MEKVERLLDLLEELGEHPELRGKLALHGGTAINLFVLDVPRLLVDIDVSCVGAVGREEMLADRPLVERLSAKLQDHRVTLYREVRVAMPEGHSSWGIVRSGEDHVKIDCIYMNRSPLFPVARRCPSLRPDLGVCMFSDVELVGGKAKAFFDRVKMRDLYDTSNLGRWLRTLSSGRTERMHYGEKDKHESRSNVETQESQANARADEEIAMAKVSPRYVRRCVRLTEGGVSWTRSARKDCWPS